MLTLLFDIDGTLIRTRGAGFLAIGRAMSELFGVEELPSVAVHGRTDRAILSEMFSELDIEFDSNIAEFQRRYWRYLPETMKRVPSELLPGVEVLLDELSQRDDVVMGLLTGNAMEPAKVKLRHFGLEGYFPFGGYGDDDECRNSVAALARRAASEFLASEFDPDRVWVIGDTVHDIDCARAIGSRVCVVETGGGGGPPLASHGPDLQMADLTDASRFIAEVCR